MELLTFNGALVSHGGAREGAGRKGKYTDKNGVPFKTRRDQVPDILTEKDIEDLAREKAEKLEKESSKAK